MTKERVKNFVRKHKTKLIVGGGVVLGGLLVGIGACKINDAIAVQRSWERVKPYNDDDMIVAVNRGTGNGRFKDHVLIGLRNGTADELAQAAKEALVMAGKSEDTVIGQALITTIKEEK